MKDDIKESGKALNKKTKEQRKDGRTGTQGVQKTVDRRKKRAVGNGGW